MGPRDAHPAGLGVQPGRERRAQGVDPPAEAVLGLEHGDPVPLALELEGGHEPGEAGPHDHHALAPGGAAVEPLDHGVEDLGVDRCGVGRRVSRGLVVAHWRPSATGISSRIPAWMAYAFLTAASMAPSIQRRARRSQASLANQIRPTGRTMSS